MRVLHVATAFPRADDDPITPWLGKLLLELRGRGLDVEVLAPAYRGSPSGEWRGIPVHRFRYAPRALETLTHDETVPDRLRRKPTYALLLPPYLASGMAAAHRRGATRPDVIHVHWPMPHALLGAVARTASGGWTRVVSSYYSVELRWVERRLGWLTPFLRWSIETSDEVTAISSATAARVRALVPREVRVIPFAAAVEPAPAAPARAPIDPDRSLEILFVGRLVERKGVETLVRALRLVLERREARLTIVGEGEWRSRIEEVVRKTGMGDRVRLTGRLSEKDLQEAYATCDLFVLPAVLDRKGDTEGLGVVLLEALRFGRPVVASAVGGIPDVVEEGTTGWLVRPGDEGALASAILEAADDPVEARRRAEAGRTRSRERFGLPEIATRLIECYESAVRRRPGRGPTRGDETGGITDDEPGGTPA